MTVVRIVQCKDAEQLPNFVGLDDKYIVMPETPAQFNQALEDIARCSEIGFDTESKPTFKPGEVSGGPHLLQFATTQTAYLFQVGLEGCLDAAKFLLESNQILKIGFGLSSDRTRLRTKLGIELGHYLDLGTALHCQAKKGQVGLRGAVAAVLQATFAKPRRISTSNWANPLLTQVQQRYAANDAYAALKVFLAIDPTVRESLRAASR